MTQRSDRAMSDFSSLLSPLPQGVLFYPCCARDVAAPVRWFRKHVDAIHFADLADPPPGRVFGGVPVVSRSSEAVDVPPVTPGPTHDVPPEVAARLGMAGRRQVLALRTGTTVIWHQYDAVHAFKCVNDVSVFFSRSDGPTWGEGSSGIPWLGTPLIESVIQRLLPGGLLVTDGANAPPTDDDVAWMPLWEGLDPSPSFKCFGRVARFIGTLPPDSRHRRPTNLWKIDDEGA